MNNIYFNDPNFDSRKFKPLKGIQPGMTEEEHRRIVSAAIKMLGPEIQIPDIERLLQEAQRRVKNVRDYATAVADEHVIAGKILDKKLLWQEIQEKFLENFSHYNREELHIIVTWIFTQLVVKEVM